MRLTATMILVRLTATKTLAMRPRAMMSPTLAMPAVSMLSSKPSYEASGTQTCEVIAASIAIGKVTNYKVLVFMYLGFDVRISIFLNCYQVCLSFYCVAISLMTSVI